MNRISVAKLRKRNDYPWVVRRLKDRIVIEIMRTRIPCKRKPLATVSPDCKPEIW